MNPADQSPLEYMHAVSQEYARLALIYRTVTHDAAVAEATHKAARAQAILRFKAGEERVSHAEAETRAEADEAIADLLMRRLTTAALAESHKQKLFQLKEEAASSRTAVTSERLADQHHAAGMSGAA